MRIRSVLTSNAGSLKNETEELRSSQPKTYFLKKVLWQKMNYRTRTRQNVKDVVI